MRNLRGKTVLVSAGGMEIKGTLVADFANRVIIRDKGGLLATVLKDKISFFAVKEEDFVKEASADDILVVKCGRAGCKGAFIFKEKMEANPEEMTAFMKLCQSRNQGCKGEILGCLGTLPLSVFEGKLNNILIGDFPDGQAGT